MKAQFVPPAYEADAAQDTRFTQQQQENKALQRGLNTIRQIIKYLAIALHSCH